MLKMANLWFIHKTNVLITFTSQVLTIDEWILLKDFLPSHTETENVYNQSKQIIYQNSEEHNACIKGTLHRDDG